MAVQAAPHSIEDGDPRDRRKQVWALLLLLLLVPSLLCLIAQLAIRSTMTHQADTDALSRLSANYGPWTRTEYLPVDRAIIEAARLDRSGLALEPGPNQRDTQTIAELPDAGGPPSGRDTTRPTTQPPTTATPAPPASPSPTLTTTASPPTVTSPPPTPLTTTPPPPPGGDPDPGGGPPPPPPPPGGTIFGLVFEDADSQDGAYASGSDSLLPNVLVRLFTAGGTSVASTSTDSLGAFSFTVNFNDSFVIHVVSATIGDADTPPAQGCNGGTCTAVAEETFEHDGTTGNNGDGALGGDDPSTPDTNNPATPGDTVITFSVSSADVTGLQMGFSYNLVVNTNPNGQGSLDQFIQNGNAIAGENSSEFAIPTSGPNVDANCTATDCTITPPSAGLTEVNDSGNARTTIDGATQASGHNIVIDGSSAASNVSGLVLRSEDNLVNDVTVQNFDNGSAATGIEIRANGNQVTNSTLDGNVQIGVADVGQVHILDGADDVTVSGNMITNSNGDGVRIDACTPGPCVGSENVTISNNTITGSAAEGMTIRDANNLTLRGNTVNDNQGAAGIQIYSTINSFIQGNTIQNNVNDGIRLEGGTSNVTIEPDPATSAPNTINGNFDGILITGDSDNNTIRGNDIHNNRDDGVNVEDDLSAGNTITQNQIYDNTADGIDLEGTANDSVQAPSGVSVTIVNPTTIQVDGTVAEDSTVEVFQTDGAGEGQTYLGSLAAPAGAFSQNVTVSSAPTEINTTATDTDGNTSEFSASATP